MAVKPILPFILIIGEVAVPVKFTFVPAERFEIYVFPLYQSFIAILPIFREFPEAINSILLCFNYF
jgi:hypothetical protein